MILRVILFNLISFSCFVVYSQPIEAPVNLPLNRELRIYEGEMKWDTAYNTHTQLLPLLQSLNVKPEFDYDDREGLIGMWMFTSPAIDNYFFEARVKRKSRFMASPLLHGLVGLGKSNDSSDTYLEKGIGVTSCGSIGKKFALGADYLYFRSTYTDYVQNYIDREGVVPGSGAAFQKGDYSESNSYSGYLSWTPDSVLNLQIGVGKHFIGHGYRSLLLSDNSFVYPYGKIQLNIWKIKYQVLYAGYTDFRLGSSEVLRSPDKYSTSNYLSMNIGKHAQVGLFQAVVWQSQDSLLDRGFDVNYLNPVIFTRPVEYSVGSPDNALLGLEFSYKLFQKNMFYSQLILDEFLLDSLRSGNGWWANKYGFQIGFKMYELFGIKGASLLLERNEVRPYTYAHTEITQNYAHYNQPLAHPLGANFREYIMRLNYHHKRWLYQLNLMYAEKGQDLGSVNYGGNIYRSNKERKSTSGNYITQGNLVKLTYGEVRASYLINPYWNLLLDLGITYRQADIAQGIDQTSQMFHFGLKSSLYNSYRDF